jgi:uncharacterized protein YjbJ (UPF0337 family)
VAVDQNVKGASDALDYRRSAFDSLAIGYGQLVYAGWFYSHSPGPGGGRSFDPPDPRAKPSVGFNVGGTRFHLLTNSEHKLIPEEIVMNKDQVKGKAKDVAGRVERQVGEWTGDPKKQVNGAVKQAEGKVQNAWGNAKDAGEKAAEKSKTSTPAEDESATETEVEVRRRKAS